MLTVAQVSKALHVSEAWVYSHKRALRGFQLAEGCALRFPENIIAQIQEGSYAISGEERQMESLPHDCGGTKDKVLQYKGRGK